MSLMRSEDGREEKMKDFVEREVVKELFERYRATEDALALVDSIPAADVAPVRHGRWIDAESDDGCTVWHCSKCSYPIKIICGYPIYKYCPMCGALMGEKEADHD